LLVTPHPELWSNDPARVAAWQWLLHTASVLQIIFGAATMLFFGWLCVGPRKTLLFFLASLLISLLLGLLIISKTTLLGVFAPSMSSTFSSGGLGISFTLLAWFYMGFTSYLLASKLASRLGLHHLTFWALALGTYFLVAWAAILNVALSHVSVPMQPSVLHLYGSVFGLPVYNLLNWIIMCVVLLGVIQLFWRDRLQVENLAVAVPVGIYTANLGFAMILSLGMGLWFPLLLSALFVLAPETLALYPREEGALEARGGGRGRGFTSQVIWLIMYGCTLVLTPFQLKLSAEGLENIPRSGPVLIAARHFHYFYDGFIFVRTVPRRLHTIISLDWVRSQGLRLVIELLCGLADWPVILRGAEMRKHTTRDKWVYQPADSRRYLRQVLRAAARLLRAGEVLIIFPEGHPNVDPHPTPKADLEAFLPFQPGFVKMVERAQRDGSTRVAIVPAGLVYSRGSGKTWRARVRFGPALFLQDFASSDEALRVVQERVKALSYAPPSAALPERSGESEPS
jgi:putative membrane protein